MATVAGPAAASRDLFAARRHFATNSDQVLASDYEKVFQYTSGDLALMPTPDTSDEQILPQPPAWSQHSRRCGLIGQKVGMMNVWDEWGRRVTVTVVKIDRNQVTAHKKQLSWRLKRVGVQIGAGTTRPHKVKFRERRQFQRAGIEMKKKVMEFQVTPDALLPVGFELTVRHFMPGQLVDVQGTTKGKGTMGVMKRWGFSGMPASHGTSLKHRHPGSIGQEGVGRVFPGKKMAGKFGRATRTVQNVQVFKIDVRRNVLFLRGQVPGNNGGWLKINDAIREPFTADAPPPFPSYAHTGVDDFDVDDMYAAKGDVDPFEVKRYH